MIKEFSKRIFLAVTGMSPQIVTETLFSLVTEKNFIPTEIHLLTTLHGKNRAMRDLLDPTDGKFLAFCKDYNLENKIAFDESHIHVIANHDGKLLEDIRTPEENASAADMIVDVIRNFCSDKTSALHVSIAGGRKSMGFFIGYALSLFARPQDELSHVLVSEPFENNKDFFYPAQSPREIYDTNGRPLDASQAKVMLAKIPIVKLRAGLPNSLLEGKNNYSVAVNIAQKLIAPQISLKFDYANNTAICSGVRIKLPPLQFALLLWMAERTQQEKPPVRPGINAFAEEFLSVYKRVVSSSSGDYINACNALKNPEDFRPYFQEKRSGLHKTLQNVLGKLSASNYFIESSKKRLNTSYRLTLPTEAINLDK